MDGKVEEESGSDQRYREHNGHSTVRKIVADMQII
jgi:hypothetical protein